MRVPVGLSVMCLWTRLQRIAGRSCGGNTVAAEAQSHTDRLRTDGGERRDRDESADEEEKGKNATETDEDAADVNGTAEADTGVETEVDASNVDVAEPGEAEPAEPRWERIDPDDIPEFEIHADQPVGVDGSADDADGNDRDATTTNDQATDPTAGRPNTARSPGQSRIKQGGTEGYIVALEICARLPDDVRLPDEAADLVPVAVEAELEEDIRAFAAAEFETARPSVETLSFDEADDEIWMRLRLGISPDAFADLDPDEIREHALQRLEGLF